MTAWTPAFASPVSVAEAASLLAAFPSATTRLLGGGTHVMSQLNDTTRTVTHLIDLSGIREFRTIDQCDQTVTLGAAVTYTSLLSVKNSQCAPPLLRKIAGWITGGPQIRNQGTIGGSACYANPASDIPTGLLALEARMVCVSAERGVRIVDIDKFFKGAFLTTLADDELLTKIDVPVDRPGDVWGYAKLKTAESSWPVAVAAARLRKAASGAWLAHVTIGASTVVPTHVGTFEFSNDNDVGRETLAHIQECVNSLPAGSFWTDELVSDSYRKRVASSAAFKAILDAFAERGN
ncbi:FAD binding domain-containing protein [Paraburkholderia caledonica]|nr:FAD binding domain-containing protein [Paraburkholderia caledonica]